MLKDVNIDFFKNSKAKAKLCAIGIGIMVGMNLTGCTNTSDMNKDITVESLLEEKATIELNYQGLETLEESDLLTFTKLDTKEMMGIATTDSDKKELQLPPGEYGVLSDYLEYQEFEIKSADQKFEIQADYDNKVLNIEEKTASKGIGK